MSINIVITKDKFKKCLRSNLYLIMKKIHISIEVSDEVKEGSIGFYPDFWKGYISQVRGHKVVEYITEGYED